MKLALVQPKPLVIKLADTIEELLQLEFDLDPYSHRPRVHRVSDEVCFDETGAALVAEIEQQTQKCKFKFLKLPPMKGDNRA